MLIRQLSAKTLIISSVLGLVALQFLTDLSLAPDESHYWDWSRRLDLGYYSKGPLIAWLIASSTSVFGDTQIAVRLVAVCVFVIFLLVLASFLNKYFGEKAGMMGLLAALTSPLFLQAGIVTTTDTPAILCWLISLWAGYLAITTNSLKYFIILSIAVGIGILAKYTVATILPGIVLFLILRSEYRRILLSWRFAVAILTLLAVLSPIIIWNSNHEWVNFAHNSGHIVRSDSAIKFKPRYFFELIGGQLAAVGPILFCILVFLGARVTANLRSTDSLSAYLVCTALPLSVVVLVVSLFKPVYANWPLPIYVSLLPLLFGTAINLSAWMKRSLQLNGILTAIGLLLFCGMTFGLPPKLLFTKKLMGWEELGKTVEKVAPNSDFIIADDYGIASALAFYMPSHPTVFCAKLDDRRMNQYDVWGGWEKIRGRNLFIILKHQYHADELRGHFSALDPVPELSEYKSLVGGREIRSFYFYRGINYDGFSPPKPLKR
jgi:undecaprenyl-diphosphatase